ncbi:hypothetical protein BDW59DRAFT_175287 [Aspergillus cavernicola]|uniref:PHD-type domain-containing protein n=1 Tax=Aspergillus cavernicola TaxID=176166 RepID=A0ABR4HS48_9EURO
MKAWRYPVPVLSSRDDGLYEPSALSHTTKRHIYDRWVASGKPHNFICSQCREPANLILCGTCCRSYHLSCLSPADLPKDPAHFYCPSCKTSNWDHSPPKFEPSTSSHVSGASTPTGRGGPARVIHPSRSLGTSPGSRLGLSQRTSNSMQSTNVASPTTEAAAMFSQPPEAFDPSMLTRAREFLLAHGGFSDSQEFSVDLLLKLGSMISELEFHRDQTQELVSENAHLRQDNANIRAYLDSNLSTGRPAANSGGDRSMIPRPSADTTGKSWDRILMDLI